MYLRTPDVAIIFPFRRDDGDGGCGWGAGLARQVLQSDRKNERGGVYRAHTWRATRVAATQFSDPGPSKREEWRRPIVAYDLSPFGLGVLNGRRIVWLSFTLK